MAINLNMLSNVLSWNVLSWNVLCFKCIEVLSVHNTKCCREYYVETYYVIEISLKYHGDIKCTQYKRLQGVQNTKTRIEYKIRTQGFMQLIQNTKNVQSTEYKKCTGALQVATRLSRYSYMPTRILTNPILSISTT